MKRRTAIALVLLGVAISVTLPVLGANFLDGGKDAGENVVFHKQNGPNVTVGTTLNFTTENPWQNSNEIVLDPYATFTSTGNTEVRVDTWNQTWTNLSQLDVASANLTVAVNDKQTVTVGGDAATLKYTDMAVDDNTVDFLYSGASGTTTLTIQDLPANTQIAAVNVSASDNDVLDVATTDASGTLTYVLPNSDHTVELQTSSGGPTIDDSSLTPNTTTSSVDDVDAITLEANVSDPDFPDDEVNMSFYVDGQYVGSDIVQDAGTASVTIAENIAGEYDWHVEAEDAYGQTDTSNTAHFLVPNEVRVYNETDPQSLIKSSGTTTITLTIRFYGPNEFVAERTSTDGTVNMTGLPADVPFIVTARVDGYYDRRIYISSLLNQTKLYLLPESQPSVYNVFTLIDRSGSYEPRSTRLVVRRALNTTDPGGLEFVTISGDYFGAVNEHETNLRTNRRYRLVVANDQGDRRIVGSYTATDEDNPKRVTIRDIIVDPPNGTDYYGTAWMEDSNETDGTATVWFTYSDPSGQTDSLNATIHERGNESNVLATVDVTNVGDSFAWNKPVSDNTAWVVNWTASRNGQTVGQNIPVGDRGSLPIPMDPVWVNRIILVFLPVTAAFSSERVATIGALAVVGLVGMLMLLQWYDVSPALWMASLVIAAGGHALSVSKERGAYG